MPVRMVVTAGTIADCTQAAVLIGGIAAECLLAGKGYDTNKVLAAAYAVGMTPVLPPQRSRGEPQDYDAELGVGGFLEFDIFHCLRLPVCGGA